MVILPTRQFEVPIFPKIARLRPSVGEETKCDSSSPRDGPAATSRQHLRRNCAQLHSQKHPPLPEGRTVHDVNTTDPAQLRTYAATSLIPGAGWGLFSRCLIGPNSPEDDGEYIGCYSGGERMIKAEIQRYEREKKN